MIKSITAQLPLLRYESLIRSRFQADAASQVEVFCAWYGIPGSGRAAAVARNQQPRMTRLLPMFACLRKTLVFAALGLALRAGLPTAQAVGLEGEWFARKWESEDGLPENGVTGVAQGKDGYIWVSTQHALTRFDGVRFEQAQLPEAHAPTEPSLHALLVSREGQLWVAMESGVVMCLSPGATNVFTRVSGLPMSRPIAGDQDASGAVWIGYADGSACRITGGQVERFDARHGLAGEGSCSLAADAEGRLWYAKAGRIGVFRDGRFVQHLNFGRPALKLCAAREGGLWLCSGLELWRHLPEKEPKKVAAVTPVRPSASTHVLLEDRAGAVWIGTSAGLFRYDTRGMSFISTSHPEITDLAEDREGNIWAGTDGGGLNRIRPGVVSLETSSAGLPFTTTRSMCTDMAGKIWAVSQTGVVWQKTNAGWQIIEGQGAWQRGQATCVCPAADGGVWIGTQSGALHSWHEGGVTSLRREHGLAGGTIRALLLATNADLWIGEEDSNCVQRVRNNQFTTFSLPAGNRPVRAMAEDISGHIWMGTAGGHLFRFAAEKLMDDTPQGSPHRPIRCLYATADGSIWIGYAGLGIGRIKGSRFSHVGVSKGLHDEFVSQICADGKGSLWIGADRGIFEIRQRELEDVIEGRLERVRSLVYGRDEGLPSLLADYGYHPSVLREPSGQLWFPMRTGLAVIRPETTRTSHIPPPVVIERVLLDGVEAISQVSGDSAGKRAEPALSVPPNHRKIEIEFTALSFVAPDNVLFKHRLEGVDATWSEPSTERAVSYPRLPHGNYRFVLTACNRAGVWSLTATSLKLDVRPFYWQTWWFGSVVALASALALAGMVRFVSYRSLQRRLAYLERETAVHQERVRIAKDIHDDLGASLTQIALLGELAMRDLLKPDDLKTQIDRIASTARGGIKSLEEIVWAVNPRNDTLAHLLDYVGQYAVDFLQLAGIRCRIDFPDQPPSLTLSADVRHNLFLATKEALNNIAKHSKATEVWLRATVAHHTLRLAIEDNGRGFAFDPESCPGNGLRNLRQRLTEIGGACETESVPGHGTRISISLSLNG